MAKFVWVHAWEYVNPGPEAGGGGFDWFYDRNRALASYEQANRESHWAHYFFPYQIESDDTRDTITNAIDSELFNATDNAAQKWIGADVAKYLATLRS